MTELVAWVVAVGAAVGALVVIWRQAFAPCARAVRWAVTAVGAGARRRRALAAVPGELAKATAELAAVGVQLHVLTGHFLAYVVQDDERNRAERSRLAQIAGDVDAAHNKLRAHADRLAALETHHPPEDHDDKAA